MESEQVKRRFGRCPYCRAMIYQDPQAVIYYCSKCRTPIRGKNPEPTDDTEYSLAQLEILSFDTMSTYSDETDPPNGGDLEPSSRDNGVASSSSAYRPYSAIRTGPRSGDLGRHDEADQVRRSGSPLHSRVSELRPASRRTRRPASADLDAPKDGGGEFDVPRTRSASSYGRRASPLSSQELDAAMALAGDGPAAGVAARSPLADPGFQQNLLHALENLRKLIVAVEEPLRLDAPRLAPGVPPKSASGSNSAPQKVTRRDSRILRRLESQLAQALPVTDSGRRIGKPTTSSSLSSWMSASASALAPVSAPASASSSRRGASARHLICRPVMGGTPFVLCDKCEEILLLPAGLSVDKFARLQCGGCDEMLEVTLPARGGGSTTDRPRKIFSAPQPAGFGADDAEEQNTRATARSRLSGEQLRQGPDHGLLHHVLGYSSVSSVLRSRRYDDEDS
ncbi:hypothetical protein CFC21_048532 [Triticum aestivum]|uniref:Probable zinc-ribbon domain-containing protein n=3 Tax=Triticinae TaxID=1648030 RepID=A0A9R1K2B6_WHEAT|nr:uncharacterized protein LOC109771716 [Aegilops tauschii subsp. strangulata]XP_044358299.1 uncharacterized protein LOC123079570 [Triticum aestivum]KAF7038333.1 hypothetical protein CFC21_048531 [Triticum aestivum]KAF7038334.1 hypothetical protein CFC21_048532 [Triticum aestivum]